MQYLNKYGVIYDNVKDELEAMKEDEITPRAEFPGGAEEEGREESLSSQRKLQTLNQRLQCWIISVEI